ncbi:hypothetical protein NG697_12670 [Pseudarthrobacter sp. MDT3-26]|uniref:hypothetical protein n=1 Tax=Pseudarthrobacter raffinosi TaxID=2953651 RepID=UPI00208E7CF8|nr:hypothetical protein [Pseudarthrobacter sp. MDT3-26]MCO4263765.1 hypothetical protein [Pseudarthrobacter sp. MDT3-26]
MSEVIVGDSYTLRSNLASLMAGIRLVFAIWFVFIVPPDSASSGHLFVEGPGLADECHVAVPGLLGFSSTMAA